MLLIKNYNEVSEDEKAKLIDDLFTTTCYFMRRDKTKVFSKFEKSRTGKMPQYVFLYDDQKMIGYAIIMGTSVMDPDVQFWMNDNHDELPKEQALYLLNAAYEACKNCNDKKILKLLETCIEEEKSVKE